MSDPLTLIKELDQDKNKGLLIGKCYKYLWNYLDLLVHEGKFQTDKHTYIRLLKLNHKIPNLMRELNETKTIKKIKNKNPRNAAEYDLYDIYKYFKSQIDVVRRTRGGLGISDTAVYMHVCECLDKIMDEIRR